jgi:hypothetical protein
LDVIAIARLFFFYFGPRMMWREACLVLLLPPGETDGRLKTFGILLLCRFSVHVNLQHFQGEENVFISHLINAHTFLQVLHRRVLLYCPSAFRFLHPKRGLFRACHGFDLVIMTSNEIRRNV